MVWFLKKDSEKKVKIPDGMWIKCEACQRILHKKELEENLRVCPKCNYHFRLSAHERIVYTVDEGSFEEFDANLQTVDPLEFVDSIPYTERIKKARETSGNLKEAIVTGKATINGKEIMLGVMDFAFIGGSMGSVVGEKVTRLAERALQTRKPLIIFSASGGARMQEGILSLMQMAKTASAIARLSEGKVLYISVLTNPTTAGVLASYAGLGDILIAEPKALIGFAGPRVIEQTIKQKLPEGFQTAEFLLEHGLIDMVVDRREMKKTLSQLLSFFVDV